MQVLSSTAQNDEDRKGLKLEKIGQLFQVRLRHILRIPKILVQLAFLGKSYPLDILFLFLL